jgi:hypothetical protein
MTTRWERDLQAAEDRAFRKIQREILILEREVKRLDVRHKRLEITALLATLLIVVASLATARLLGCEVCRQGDAAVALGVFFQSRQ